jgi:formate C-acetyltransferase
MLSLIRTIFEKGGSAAQCGIYSAELLRDAQEHPELHRGLQVRLCGWSQYFDKLTRDEQDMLIRQAEVGAR